MSTDSNISRSARRRPSLILRTRPRTAAPGEPSDLTVPWATSGPWVANRTASNSSHISSLAQQFETQAIIHHSNREQERYNGQVLEEITAFPDATPRQRAAKSFSSLRHGVDGLRALGRRLSVTMRRKSSKHNLQVPCEEDRRDDDPRKYQTIGAALEDRSGNAWFKRPSINRRPSLHSVSALQTFYAPTGHLANSIPCMGFEPPVFSDSLSGGAAARAAAAAQNEMAKAERVASRGDSKIFDPIDPDSESGIGIDLRDRADGSEVELAVVRLGIFSLTLDTHRVQPADITYRPCRILPSRTRGSHSLMPGPRVSHASRDCVPFLEQSCDLAPCVEDCLPPRV